MRLLGFREPVANPHNFCKAKKLCGFTTKEPQRKTKRETNAYAMLQQNRYPQTGTQIIWPAIMQATYRSFAFPKRRTSGTSLHGQRKLCGNHPGWFSAKAIFSYLFFECHLPSAHRNTPSPALEMFVISSVCSMGRISLPGPSFFYFFTEVIRGGLLYPRISRKLLSARLLFFTICLRKSTLQMLHKKLLYKKAKVYLRINAPVRIHGKRKG